LFERAGFLPLHSADNATSIQVNNGTGVTPGYAVKNGNDTSKTGDEPTEIEDPIIEILWSITVAIFVLFGMIGAFISGHVADKFGRCALEIYILFFDIKLNIIHHRSHILIFNTNIKWLTLKTKLQSYRRRRLHQT